MWAIENDQYLINEKRAPRSGGMADVYQARDLENDCLVAVKLFQRDLDSHPLHALAYQREYKALSQLSHHHIVRLLQCGRDERTGRRYFVMEWLPSSLEDKLKELALEGWDGYFSGIGKAVLDALVYAYSRNVIHRDIKPGNIMFDEHGVLRVVDFNISRMREYLLGGRTLADHRSPPYGPPEQDTGFFSDARDVYGWAALAVSCLAGKRLGTYEELYAELDDIDIPEDVYALLGQCLSERPADRPKNIVELANVIEPLMEARAAVHVVRPAIHLVLTASAERKIQGALSGSATVAARAESDLMEGCVARRWQYKPPQGAPGSSGIELMTPRLRYRCQVGNGALKVIDVISVEFVREQGELDREYAPEVIFKIGLPSSLPDAMKAVEHLLGGIEEHSSRQKERDAVEQAERPFRVWEAALQAKADLDRQAEAPLKFVSSERRGTRGVFKLDGEPGAFEVGERRLIRLRGRTLGSGELEGVASGEATLLLSSGSDAFEGGAGELVLDSRAGKAAINRQREALERFRLDSTIKLGARRLLLEPEAAALPASALVLPEIDPELDPDKRDAVARALGARDCLVVQGPPGTGKTRFIVELIAQKLASDSSARILLSAQTHVAVDNALERLRARVPTVNCVRIASSEAKVAEATRDILLPRKAHEWLQTVEARTDEYIVEWATRRGLSWADVKAGLAVNHFRTALRQFEDAERQCRDLQRQRDEASEQIDGAPDMPASIAELEGDLLIARGRAKELKKALDAKRRELQKVAGDLHEDGEESLGEWQSVLLGEGAAAAQCERVLSIIEDWRLRLENAPDFYAALMAEAQVVAGTCVGVSRAPGFDALEFDLAILDEASKATVTEAMVSLSRARTWVIVGDSRQLPPHVDGDLLRSEILQRHELTKADIEETMLSRFESRLPAECVTRLTHQRRMVREVGELISQCFYDGALRHLAEHDVAWLRPMFSRPVVWVSTTKLPDRHEKQARRGFINATEANAVEGFLRGLAGTARIAGRRTTVGVLTGYLEQKHYLDRLIQALRAKCEMLDIEVNTVDAFQGREVDVCLYSVVRSNVLGRLGFLAEHRRLNVALSRARLGLAIIGDMSFIQSASGENPFRAVLEHIEKHPEECAIDERQP